MINVYMLTTADKYELPLAVADSIFELARMTGITYETIRQGLDRSRRGKKSKWVMVQIDE